MFYLCLLASVLLGACTLGIAFFAVRESLAERSFVPLVLGGLLVPCVGFLAIMPLGMYYESQQPAFALIKRDWRCTASHTDTTVIMQKVGDVTVPQTITQEICDRYDRVR